METSSWEVFESIFSDKVFTASSEIHSLACDEDFICAGLRNGKIFACDQDSEETFELAGHNLTVNALWLSKIGLVSGGQDSIICIWDLKIKALKGQIPAHDGVITALGGRESLVYSAGIDLCFKVWDAESIGKVGEVKFDSIVCCIKVVNDGLYLGTEEGSIYLLNLELEKLKELNGHGDSVWGLSVWMDYLVSCSYDGTVRLWEKNSEHGHLIGEHDGVVNKVVIFDPSNAGIPMIVSVGSDCVVKLWAIDGLKDYWEFHSAAIAAIEVLDMSIVTAGFDKQIRVWSLMNHLRLKRIFQAPQEINDFCFIDNKFYYLANSCITPEINCLAGLFINSVCYSNGLLAVSTKEFIKFFDIQTNKEMKSWDTEELCSSISIWQSEIVACSKNFAYFCKEDHEIRKISRGGESIDISPQFIILSGNALTLLDKNFNELASNPLKFDAVMFSRNYKFFYASDQKSVHIFLIPSLEKLASIQSLMIYKRLKLHKNLGITGCQKDFIYTMPEYDIEKALMLPD